MTIWFYILWFAIIIVSYVILSLIQIPIYSNGRIYKYLILIGVKLILIVVFAYLVMNASFKFTWKISPISGAIYLALMGDMVLDAFTIIYRLIEQEYFNFPKRLIIGLILTLLISSYGLARMIVVKPNIVEYESEKIENDYEIVFLSDLHYGSSQSEKTLDRIISKIKYINPDFLILGGDITDEYTTKEELYTLYSKIGKLNIKTYFIYGNHDRQKEADRLADGFKYSELDLIDAITSNGIIILDDEYALINDDLILLGREAYNEDSRLDPSLIEGLDHNKYIINVDHSPYQYDDYKIINADLQLSGHTHAGQLFPLKYVYNFFEKYIYGKYKVGSTSLYVSPGVAGWRIPLRTEEHSQIEVIYLQRK